MIVGSRMAWAVSLNGIPPKAKLIALYLASCDPGPEDAVSFDVSKISEWTNIPVHRIAHFLPRIPDIKWWWAPDARLVVRWKKDQQQEAEIGADTVQSGGRSDG